MKRLAAVVLALALAAPAAVSAWSQQPTFRPEAERTPTDVQLGQLTVATTDDGRQVQLVQVLVLDQDGEAMRQQVVPLAALLEHEGVRQAWEGFEAAVLALARADILPNSEPEEP